MLQISFSLLRTREKFEMILSDVNNARGGMFFLDASRGTIKTFTTHLFFFLSTVRVERKIALAVVSSGIAATLFLSRQTAHRTFKLPLDLQLQ